MSDMPELDWSAEELAHLDCHDVRLNARSQRVLKILEAHPTLSIPAACGKVADIKATYDFFDNPKVTADAVLASHAQATQARMAEYDIALLIADLTELNYTDKTVAQELGCIGDNNTCGLFFIPLLAVSVEGDVLGLAASQQYERTDISEPSQKRKHLPITEKETRYILQAYQQACEIQTANKKTQCIFVYDRGGDIYEVYQEAQYGKAPRADFLIRGREYERCLQSVVAIGGTEPTKDSQTRYRKLDVLLLAAPSLGEMTFEVPKTETQSAREVTQEIRTVTVTLNPPYRKGVTLLPTTVTVIWCHEVNPPAGAKPIDWILYTSLSVTTSAKAQWVIQRYLQRWDIELYFNILKSGCHVEQLYLQTKPRLQNALAFYFIVAWRIFQLARIGRQIPDVPCTLLFSELEWRTLVGHFTQRIPEKPPLLQEAIRLVGRLGGYVGRRGDGEPGIKTLWIGMSRLRDMVQGAMALMATGLTHVI
jgi:hypothetical protein